MSTLTSMLLALQDALPEGAIERGSDAVEETWRFLEMPAMWVVALLIVPGSLAIAAIAYSRESLSRRCAGPSSGCARSASCSSSPCCSARCSSARSRA